MLINTGLVVGWDRAAGCCGRRRRWRRRVAASSHAAYADVNLVTAFVPSDMACLTNSPGSTRRAVVCTSREDSVDFLLMRASLPASPVMRSKMSLMTEFKMDGDALL